VGRVAASDVVAERPVPHYDRAAMDGYAVRARDTHGASERSPARLGVVEDDVSDGEAAYVHTGSAVPDGADAVVRVEETEEVGEGVEVSVAVSEGNNVAYAGEDVEEGKAVVCEGARLRPSRLGVLRSVGVDEVEVREKPLVASSRRVTRWWRATPRRARSSARTVRWSPSTSKDGAANQA